MSSATYLTGSGDGDAELSVRRDGDAIVVSAADGVLRRVGLEPGDRPGQRTVRLDGKLVSFGHVARGNGVHTIVLGGVPYDIELVDARQKLYRSLAPADGPGSGRKTVKAPIPGLITEVKVEPGHVVRADETLLVLYAMKLENEIRAPAAGVVEKVYVQAQQPVEKGAPLVDLGA